MLASIKQCVDKIAIALVDDPAAHLAGPGEFTVIRIKLFVQDQKTLNLRRGKMGILSETLVHLFNALLYQRIHLGMCREFLVTGVGHIVALGPVTHGVKININEGRDEIALIPKGDDLFDFREKLQFVLQKLRCKHAVVVHFTDVFGTVDDPEMTFVIKVSGVARIYPVVRSLGFGRCLRVLEVLLKHPGTSINNLTAVFDPHLNPGRRRTDTFGAHHTIGLHRNKDGSLGLPVQLLEIDAQRTVKLEHLRPDGLACRISHPYPA